MLKFTEKIQLFTEISSKSAESTDHFSSQSTVRGIIGEVHGKNLKRCGINPDVHG